MDILWWAIAVLLFAPCLLLTVVNGAIFWQGVVLRRRTSSWVPLVGGLSGAVSLSVVPVPGVGDWWWLPLLTDWGSIPGLGFTVLYLFYRRLRG